MGGRWLVLMLQGRLVFIIIIEIGKSNVLIHRLIIFLMFLLAKILKK